MIKFSKVSDCTDVREAYDPLPVSDSLCALASSHKDQFKNLADGEYLVLGISGINNAFKSGNTVTVVAACWKDDNVSRECEATFSV